MTESCSAHESFRTARLADATTSVPDCDMCRRWARLLGTIDEVAPTLAPAPASPARLERIVRGVVVHRPARRARSLRWVAAATLVVIGLVAIDVDRGGDTPALEIVAGATEKASTATLRVEGMLSVGVATVQINGTGTVAFPDRARLELRLEVDGGLLDHAIPDTIGYVVVGDETWLRVDEGAWQNASLVSTGVGGLLESFVFDPANLLSSLRAGSSHGGDIAKPTRQTLDGAPVDVYRVAVVGADVEPLSASLDLGRLANRIDDVRADVIVSADASTAVLRRWELDIRTAQPGAGPSLQLDVRLRNHGNPVTINPPSPG